MHHDIHETAKSNRPTLENIAKMLVGAGAGVGSAVVGFYITYLTVVYLQT